MSCFSKIQQNMFEGLLFFYHYLAFVARGAIIAMVDLFVMYLETGEIWRQSEGSNSLIASVVQLRECSPKHSRISHLTAKLIVNLENIAEDLRNSPVRPIAIVTGVGVGGIGFNTALQLLLCGFDVVGVCKVAGEAAEAEKAMSAASMQNGRGWCFDISVCDLSDAVAVGTLCDDLFEKRGILSRLAVVVTNAGVMAVPPMLSPQGIESQLATHHIGHSLLLLRLIQAKTKKNISPFCTRIVILGSGAAAGARDPRTQSLFQQHLNIQSLVDSGYNRFTSYSNAKLCNILFASALHREILSRGLGSSLTVNCLHPGPIRSRVIPNSQLPCQWLLDGELAALLRLSPVISATYVVDACVHKRFFGSSGRFLRMGIDMTADYAADTSNITHSFWTNTHWFRGTPAPRFTLDYSLQEWLLRETRKFHESLGLLA
jgi:NAD(P)-dependent dehydrogenase (short-subunit alcohol dehydrogenase family)